MGMNDFLIVSSPLVGERENGYNFTPSLVLPHQGGGNCLGYPALWAGKFTCISKTRIARHIRGGDWNRRSIRIFGNKRKELANSDGASSLWA